MALRVAFAGFRHPHIWAVYNYFKASDRVDIVAAGESDAATRASLAEAGEIDITHDDVFKMLEEVDCDAVAVGDYYGIRGAIAIDALKRGRHVISDKPLCTSLDELDQIESLSRDKQLSVFLQLDTRDVGVFQTLLDVVRRGEIGQVQAINFGGQHPLNYGTRAGWYFEEGKHGGTINDIAIHAMDFIPLLTGQAFTSINGARNWNACFPQVPFFKDSGQFMLTMGDGCGVMGDVSYLTPDSFGYGLPHYWRFNLWGRGGMIEMGYTWDSVKLYKEGESEVRSIPAGEGTPGKTIESFLDEIAGNVDACNLRTSDSLKATRLTLTVQQVADTGRCSEAI